MKIEYETITNIGCQQLQAGIRRIWEQEKSQEQEQQVAPISHLADMR